MRVPTVWGESKPEPARQAPNLGEHGRELLAEAGCTEDEIAAWAADGALVLPDETPCPKETP